VFLLEPGRTQFDLNWRMFGIPVRVHPMFWIMSICLGWSAMEDGFQFVLLWVACVFVSILVHELGHVVMGRLFGQQGHIVLYSFGGLAVGSNGMSRRWQRIAVSFAGPLAGFLLFGALLVGLRAAGPDHFAAVTETFKEFVQSGRWVEFVDVKLTLARAAVYDLAFINLFWGLVNLLPVWPLDGGQISRDVCEGILGRNGLRVSLVISGVVAGLLALNALATYFKHPLIPSFAVGDIYMAIFFGLLAVTSFMTLQQVGQQRRYQRQEESERMPWERDPDYWKSGRDADHDYWER
jgi:Zn-dependent protease